MKKLDYARLTPSPLVFPLIQKHRSFTIQMEMCAIFMIYFFFATEYEGKIIASNAETLAVDWFKPRGLPEVTSACKLSIAAFLEFKKTGIFQII